MASDAGGWKLPAIPAQSPATIIYTSGTTGQPKGILYRHEQVVLAIHAITEAYPSIAVGSRFVCWLPLSNLFQRIMNLAAMHVGGTVYLVANPLDVLKALPVAKPDIFIGVPRFYEKLYDGMQKEIERKPAPVRWLIRKSIDLALEVSRVRRDGGKVPAAKARALRLADRVVLAKLRSVMGGRIQFMVTGSAPTPMRLLEFFHAIGLPLYEAYGMSENVVPMALNRPGACRLGTVGRPLDVNQIVTAQDGELLVRGPGVFPGTYYREEHAPAFRADGFLATGDYGSLDADGFLTLGGRKSEILKTSTGRRIAPSAIEDLLQSIPEVERAMVVGNGRKCLSAIVTLNAEHRGHPDLDMRGTSRLPAALKASIAALPVEQRPGGFVIVDFGFTIEGGQLTPNLKLRRRAIEAGMTGTIDTLYQEIELQQTGDPVIVWHSRPQS
jgi:long-chain acyl-CoA synthetase